MDGKTAGPFTISEMRDLYAAAQSKGATLYAMADSQEWLPVETIKPLLAAAALPPVRREAHAGTPPTAPAANTAGLSGLRIPRQNAYATEGLLPLEVALWPLFCAPGFIYALWRNALKAATAWRHHERTGGALPEM